MILLVAGTAVALGWDLADDPVYDTLVFDVHEVDVGGMSLRAEVEAAMAEWRALTCAPNFPGMEVGGSFDHYSAVSIGDGVSTIVVDELWNAPNSPSLVYPSYPMEFDIVLNDAFVWLDEAAASDPGCTDAWSLRSVLVHEIGRALGLGESDVQTASMAELLPCSVQASTLDDDDALGFQWLYGLHPTLTCTAGEPGVTVGAVPLEISCEANEESGAPLETHWESEGDSTVGDRFDQTLADEQEAVVDACTSPGAECVETCSSWSFLACLPPDARFRVRPAEDGAFLLDNRTDIALVGCVASVLWRVFDGADQVWESNAWSPVVPSSVEGTRVELTVYGPAGTSVEEHSLAGCGCRSTPTNGPSWLLIVFAAGWARRAVTRRGTSTCRGRRW